MVVDLAIHGSLVRPGRPRIRFLSIRPRFCSTLPSDPASRRRPCASLALHLHQVVQGTCTPRLSNMLGTRLPGVPGEGLGDRLRAGGSGVQDGRRSAPEGLGDAVGRAGLGGGLPSPSALVQRERSVGRVLVPTSSRCLTLPTYFKDAHPGLRVHVSFCLCRQGVRIVNRRTRGSCGRVLARGSSGERTRAEDEVQSWMGRLPL